MPAYIPDGYNMKGYLEEWPTQHEAVRFHYRPAPYHERTRIMHGFDALTAEKQESRVLTVLEQRLLSWDMKDERGRAVPIDAPHLRRVNPAVINRIFNIICALNTGDPDPEDDQQPEDDLAVYLKSGGETATVGEADAKNSSRE